MILFKEDRRIKRAVAPYDHNKNGTCGSVAFATLLKFYHDYYDRKFFPDRGYDTKSGAMLQEMINRNYISGGTDYRELCEGADRYFEEHKLPYRVRIYDFKPKFWEFLYLRQYIKRDLPMIVNIVGHPDYGNHWCVVTGYKKGVLLRDIFIYVNDGHGKQDVILPVSYVGGFIGFVKNKS